jgi:formate hydrogenlyase transcriptional activator
MEVAADNALELAMALCEGPFSVEEALAWGFVRPSALWRIMHAAADGGAIVEGPEEGHFTWRDEERRSAIVLAATHDQWQAVLAHPRLVKRACDQARAAVHERRSDLAEALYRAVVLDARPEDCPLEGGGWVRMVVGSIRLWRNVEWRPRDVLDRAIDLAVARGDLRSQATLLATRGWEAQRGGEAPATADFESAREAALAVGDLHLIREVHVLTAASLVYAGRPLEAIAVFEQYLGDVPQEVTAPATGEADDEPPPVAEALLDPIAIAYAIVGQAPRAINIAYRILERGETSQRPSLVHLAEVTLAHVHLTLRHLDGVRSQARSAYDHWKVEGTQPLYVWLSAVALAWVCMCENKPQEAAAMLGVADPARTAAGTKAYWGSALFEVLFWLEQRDMAPEGMSLEGELAKLAATPSPGLHAIAHRFHALLRRRAAEGGDEQAAHQVDEHLAESETLLRDMGALPELVRVLQERARWEEWCGRLDRAGEVRNEAQKILERIDPDAQCCTTLSFIRAVVDIGRLTSLRPGDGMWGELTSRLCAALCVERAVIVEEGEPPKVLAARGGDEAWIAAVRDALARKPRVETALIPPPQPEWLPGVDARAALVRFVAEGSGRRGALVVENRHSRWLVDKQDPHLLEILGWQLGVILDNLALHQELATVRHQLEQETKYYREHGAASRRTDAIIGDSSAIRRVHEDVARVAATDATVLLLGETGVGKELFAREIHNQSKRRDAPFVAVHVAALTSGLVASALFGHERGAFTGAVSQVQGRFELANRGTLLLDEIGELGPEEQVRLLRVLQEGTFERVGGNRTLRSDFRLVVATNRDLDAEVRAGRFRQDLYYRLNVFPIRVPPLRERVGDIPPMALYFMERSSRRLGRSFQGISEADMERLMAYPWPGNVRELMHFIERAAVLSDGPRLCIPPLMNAVEAPCSERTGGEAAETVEWVSLAEAERRYLRRVLHHARGRVTGAGGAAEILDLKPSTLNFRIHKLGLEGDLAQARGRA